MPSASPINVSTVLMAIRSPVLREAFSIYSSLVWEPPPVYTPIHTAGIPALTSPGPQDPHPRHRVCLLFC